MSSTSNTDSASIQEKVDSFPNLFFCNRSSVFKYMNVETNEPKITQKSVETKRIL